MWRRACPESSHIDIRKARDARGAADYIGKYITKGFQTSDWNDVLRARVAAGTYGSRWVFSSRKFWQPYVPACPCCGQAVVRDVSVAEQWRTDVRRGYGHGADPPDPLPDYLPDRQYQTAIRLLLPYSRPG
jgi:hypothetical protein